MILDNLRARSKLDVDALFATFQKERPQADDDLFLSWLHEQRLISAELMCDLHGSARPRKTLILPENLRTLVPAQLPEGTSPGVRLEPVSGSRYALLGCLGRGAMGEVHLARDEDLLRKVAFKRMVPEVAKSRDLAARFFGEVQVTAQLDHPNIIPIYGLEVGEDGIGYSMKLVQGQTLARMLDEAREVATVEGGRGERERLAARLETFLKVCDAMAYAHSKGVLHRDLKPENIMVGKYHEVYVMDWGICRLMGSHDPDADVLEAAAATTAATERTQLGAVIGTPAYMSPEQAAGRNAELDGRSDLYSLGLILFEAAALRQAVAGQSLDEVLAAARAGRRVPLAHCAPRVAIAPELAAIIDKATAASAADRYAGVAELAADLRRFLHGEAVTARPDNVFQKVARFMARHRAATLAALVAVVVLGAGATIGVLAHEQRALVRAGEHERRLQAFLTQVAERAHAIDNQFHRDEALLAALAGHAAEVVARRIEGDPATAVVVHFAPGVTSADAHFAGALQPAMTAMLAGDDGSLLRVFVSLDSGVHFSAPAMGTFPDDYDGRKRPKYVLAAHKLGVQWGNPYPDQFGHGLLLPIAVSLYATDGKFLGVAGADTTFKWLRRQLMGLPGIEDAFLVDGQGRVVVKAGDASTDVSTVGDLHEDRPVALAALAYPEAVAAIRAGGAGTVTSRGKLVVLQKLSALGWYYVVVAAGL